MDTTTQPQWQPPAGFVPVESRLAGITVYAPAPEAEPATPEARTYKCPQCGASVGYDPAAAGFRCPACGFEQAVAAQAVGHAAEQAEFTLEALAREARGWGEARRELHCEACGANLSLAPTDLSTTCPFCASNRVVARAEAEDQLRPRYLVPFKVAADQCSSKAREWLGRGWMHPGGLAEAAGATQFAGVYLPFWVFGAQITADWHAQVGYERQHRYYDAGSKEWKTRTEIDWRPESGRVGVPVVDHIVPGTTKVSRVLLDRLLPFDLGGLVAYDPAFLAGWQAQGYDLGLQAAWDGAREALREEARRACRHDIASAHVRDLRVAADFGDETWRYVLLPVYLAAYRYAGKAYQVMINGQTGACAGQKPVDWTRVWLVVALLLAPGLALSLLGLPLLVAGGLGTVFLGLGGLLFVIGLVISAVILVQATRAGEA